MKHWVAIAMAVACMATAPGDACADEARRRAVDAMFQAYQQPGTPGMSVGIYYQGRVDVLAGYGMADLEQGTRITPQTRFHVASVSKQFAAYAVALLERDGRLDVTDQVRRWLPYVPDFGRPMQIQHLIHHTSGLRDQWALFQLGGLDYSGVLFQEQVVNMVARQRGLNFPPGTEHSYTNTGYTLLAEVVKAASGKSFRRFSDERIFQPLGMTRSFFVDDLTEVVPERAHSYANYHGSRWRREPLNFETYGATSLLTTAEDLLKWAGNLARPVIGDAALNRKITTLGKLDDGATINYAYGLRREPFAGHMAWVHTGHDAAFNAVFAYFPASDFAVVLLANQPARLFQHLEALVRLYLGEGQAPAPGNPPPAVPVSKPLLKELSSHYLADYGALVTLDVVGDELVWNSRSASDDRPGQKLIFRTDGTFDIGGRTRGFNFYRLRRDASGRLDGFDLISNVGGHKVTPFRRVTPAKPTVAQLQEIAGDYYSAELDATYSLQVEDGVLTARSLWLKAPIRFAPSVADRFDSGEGLLPTLIVERDAQRMPRRARIHGEYIRNMVLDRRPADLEEIGRQAGEYLRRHYTRHEFDIPMRDGVRLFTVAFVPRDDSRRHGILLERTPYGVGGRGEAKFPTPIGGPLFHYARENFIFVFQDVRGRHDSGGEFVHVRPYRSGKKSANDIDESSDTYDTLDWLVNRLPSNNGRACLLGISYAGFYSIVGAIDAHPALKCVSPQAPAIDWYMGDDFRRNGAFSLLHAWRFFTGFDPEPKRPEIGDAYSHFLRSGSLDALSATDFNARGPFWRQLVSHDTYDEFWRERDVRRHLRKLRPAVLTVGGWFDAENLHGPLNLFRSLASNSGKSSSLVMGPWAHGEWSWTDGSKLGPIRFGGVTTAAFREQAELPFLRFHLNGDTTQRWPTALVFETGAAKWRTFDTWPPRNVRPESLYLDANGRLALGAEHLAKLGGAASSRFDEFISDPARPVPFTAEPTQRLPPQYMVEDQRFAAARPDVLVYESDVLESDITLAGPLSADLLVATTGTDADWIVKLIDVYPTSEAGRGEADSDHELGGYQQLVRGEPFRSRFREGFDAPRALVPNQPTRISFALPDVLHTFRRGHRIMVQIQSSWFPLIDRNPQSYVRIAGAEPGDYRKATQRVFHSSPSASRLVVGVLRDAP